MHLASLMYFVKFWGLKCQLTFVHQVLKNIFHSLHIYASLTFRRKSTQLHQVPIIQNSCYDITNRFIVLEFQLTYAALTLIPVVHFLYEVIYGVLSKNFRYDNWIFLVQEVIEDSERNGFKYCMCALKFNTQKR